METPVNAPLKEKFRLEIAKLREMTFKDKLDHIWEYYKYHIIIILVFVFIIISLLNLWVFNPRPDTALFISWNAGFATDEQIDRLTYILEEHLIDEGKHEEVVISHFVVTGNDPSVSMANAQRTAAMIAVGEIDLFILDSDMLKEYAEIGFLLPLENTLEVIKSRNTEAYDRIVANLVNELLETADGSNESRPAGINVGRCPLFVDIGMFQQEIFVSVSVTAGRTESIVEALILFFQ